MRKIRYIITGCMLLLSGLVSAVAQEVQPLPEALFSSDGKYTLIHEYDSLNYTPVQAWTLYQNETQEEISIIIPKNDSVFFVRFNVDKDYYPFFITADSTELKCRVVNVMSYESFISHYNLSITPLNLTHKLRAAVDTLSSSQVYPLYFDSLIERKYTFSFYLNDHLLAKDTILSNVDTSVSHFSKGPLAEKTRLFYTPANNTYWLSSNIYHEEIFVFEIWEEGGFETNVSVREKQNRKRTFGHITLSNDSI